MSSNRHKRLSALFVLPAIVAAALLALPASPAGAEARIELKETEISAARELPKVLYIVPWRKTRPDPHPLTLHSLIDETLSPVEIDVFKRRVRYHNLRNEN